jgi:hypothetical protein
LGKTVTLADIRRYTEQLRAHPKFDASFSEIIDLREVEDLALKAADFSSPEEAREWIESRPAPGNDKQITN